MNAHGERHSIRNIRKQFREPRIHFALVCAALGCPPLRSEAYVAPRLEEQLEDQAHAFLLRSPARRRRAVGRVPRRDRTAAAAADGAPRRGWPGARAGRGSRAFERAGGPAKKPAIVYVHGGPPRQMLLGWHYSDYYSNAYALNQYLASRGFLVLSVNYRLGIGYGCEFHRFEPSDREEALAVAWRSSPVSSVSSWTSPVLLIHDDDDRNVRFTETVDLARRLQARGVPYEELVIVDDTHHFLLHANQLRVNRAIAEFLERRLGAVGPPAR